MKEGRREKKRKPKNWRRIEEKTKTRKGRFGN